MRSRFLTSYFDIRLDNYLGLETAQAFWSLLIPHGLAGKALTRIPMQNDGDEDIVMDDSEGGEGWKEEYLQWWFDFLNGRGGKGVTKDTWIMVCTFLINDHAPSPRSSFTYSWHSIIKFLVFIRSIDAKFSKYNADGA